MNVAPLQNHHVPCAARRLDSHQPWRSGNRGNTSDGSRNDGRPIRSLRRGPRSSRTGRSESCAGRRTPGDLATSPVQMTDRDTNYSVPQNVLERHEGRPSCYIHPPADRARSLGAPAAAPAPVSTRPVASGYRRQQHGRQSRNVRSGRFSGAASAEESRNCPARHGSRPDHAVRICASRDRGRGVRERKPGRTATAALLRVIGTASRRRTAPRSRSSVAPQAFRHSCVRPPRGGMFRPCFCWPHSAAG
jgi:hypothetical protein